MFRLDLIYISHRILDAGAYLHRRILSSSVAAVNIYLRLTTILGIT
jgi:hypothetical protein